MAIAPLHGKSSRLQLVRNRRTEWPRFRAADVRSAPLSTRARKERRRVMGRVLLLSILSTLLLVGVVAATLFVATLKG
jgi:hypothetical protein